MAATKTEKDQLRLKNVLEILNTIKEETGYDLEKFSDLKDFLVELDLLEFNKKNNKIELERRRKLLKKALKNEEELEEIFEKNAEKSDQKREENIEKNQNNSSNNHQENKHNFHRN